MAGKTMFVVSPNTIEDLTILAETNPEVALLLNYMYLRDDNDKGESCRSCKGSKLVVSPAIGIVNCKACGGIGD